MVMVANPLGWFETSNLSPDYPASIGPLVKVWKRERAAFQGGSIIPVGSVPDGVQWTGFASVGKSKKNGYLLVFRELNPDQNWSPDLSMFAGHPSSASVLAGDGTVSLAQGTLHLQINQPLGYLWLKLGFENSRSGK
jgi:hypothetical protein